MKDQDKELLKKAMCAYLPHKLNCLVTDKGETKVAELSGMYSDGTCCFHDTIESEKGFHSVMPILVPLSDIKKFKSKLFKIQEFNNDVTLLFCEADYKQFSVWEYEFLLENHFDVFGLTPKGLAETKNE